MTSCLPGGLLSAHSFPSFSHALSVVLAVGTWAGNSVQAPSGLIFGSELASLIVVPYAGGALLSPP